MIIPNILKPLIEIGISAIYLCIFNLLYRYFINTIYTSIKEEEASDNYSLLKILNYIGLFIVGSSFIIMNTTTQNYFFIIIEFFIFFLDIYYSIASLKLMDRFIYMLFRPDKLGDKEFINFVGSIENENKEKRWTFSHIYANINLII